MREIIHYCILSIFSSDDITSNGFDLIARTPQGEDVDLVDIVLEYQTLGDDALNVSLMFTHPTDLLQPPLSIESRRNVSYCLMACSTKGLSALDI